MAGTARQHPVKGCWRSWDSVNMVSMRSSLIQLWVTSEVGDRPGITAVTTEGKPLEALAVVDAEPADPSCARRSARAGWRGNLWIVLLCGMAQPAAGEMLIKPDGDTGAISVVEQAGDAVWFGAQKGAFIYDRIHNRAVPIAGDTGEVSAILRWNNRVLLRAAKGLFVYDAIGNAATPVKGGVGSVYAVQAVGSELWITGEHGAFRYDAVRDEAVGVKGVQQSTSDLWAVGSEVWLTGAGGLYCYERQRDEAVRVQGEVGDVADIKAFGSEVWLVSKKGVFHYVRATHTMTRVQGETGSIDHISVTGDDLWFTADDPSMDDMEEDDSADSESDDSENAPSGAFHWDPARNAIARVPGVTGFVTQVEAIGDETWFLSEVPIDEDTDSHSGGLFRYDRVQRRAVRLQGVEDTHAAVAIGRDILFAADNGVFRWDPANKDKAHSVPGITELVQGFSLVDGRVWTLGRCLARYDATHMALIPVAGISCGATFSGNVFALGGVRWVAAREGVFRSDADGQRLMRVGTTAEVEAIVRRGGDIWVLAKNSVYRYDPALEPSVELTGPHSWLTRLMGPHVFLDGLGSIKVTYPVPNTPDSVNIIAASTAQELHMISKSTASSSRRGLSSRVSWR
jgi:hypothetical protein